MLAFDHDTSRACLRAWIDEQPRGGYGQLSRLAKAIGVSSVFITQVLKGDRQLNPDQAFEAASYFGFSEQETEYFLLLVQEERAGGPKLRKRIREKRGVLRRAALSLSARLPADAELAAEAQAIFYSHWQYSAVRLLTSIEGYQSIGPISERLKIPLTRVESILRFLADHRLIERGPIGWTMGPQVTHLEATSPFILARQVQWRTKGFEAMAESSPENLFYTGPASLDEDAFNAIREILSKAIVASLATIKEAPAKSLACLNIDWFKIS